MNLFKGKNSDPSSVPTFAETKLETVYDLILLGGGLASSLVYLYVKKLAPHLNILIIEKSESLGGNHTWSFHQSDLDPEDFEFLRPYFSAFWKGYSVAFPKYKRKFQNGGYASIRSSDWSKHFSENIYFNSNVISYQKNENEYEVKLETQKGSAQLRGRIVLDGRGLSKEYSKENKEFQSYQKFVGQTLRFSKPHGLDAPVIMDACVDQSEGYRFFYLLPWNETDLLIEDTRYDISPDLDLSKMRLEISKYAAQHFQKDSGVISEVISEVISKVMHEEIGVLPIPLSANGILNRADKESIGMRGGFFHPTTGYSLSRSVQVAKTVASILSTMAIAQPEPILIALQKLSDKARGSNVFFCFLNRMLILGAEPSKRYVLLQRFHRFSPELVQRFYSGHLFIRDRFRILIGKPPISIRRAIQCIRDPQNRTQL